MDKSINPVIALQLYTLASALQGCLCFVVPCTVPEEIEGYITLLCDYFYSRCSGLLSDDESAEAVS